MAVTAHLSANQVYAGYSNGGASAQLLAQTREGARGALLFHAALPVEMLGADHWPPTVPVQVHYAAQDPFREQDGIDALAGSVRASGAAYEFFEYEGEGHLICDEGLAAEYNAQHCERMTERVLEFLARLGRW